MSEETAKRCDDVIEIDDLCYWCYLGEGHSGSHAAFSKAGKVEWGGKLDSSAQRAEEGK